MQKLYAKNHGPDSRDEKVISLSSNFRGRQSDIVAYRDAVCNRKGSPRVHWIQGKKGFDEMTLFLLLERSTNRIVQATFFHVKEINVNDEVGF